MINMKSTAILLFFKCVLCVYSQDKIDTVSLCNPLKLLPSSSYERTPDLLDAAIDSITFDNFKIHSSNLYFAMKNNFQLSKENDIILLKIINTLRWSEWDKQRWLIDSIPQLPKIEKFYDSLYWRYLRCKYIVSLWGGAYFRELDDIIIGDTPGRSSRFIVHQNK